MTEPSTVGGPFNPGGAAFRSVEQSEVLRGASTPANADTQTKQAAPGGVLNSPSSAEQRNARLQTAYGTIANLAQYAGLDLPPAHTHADWAKNAVTVFNKLIEISSYHPPAAIEANKFLDTMSALGKADGLNFGLKTLASKEQPKSVPLNDGVAQSSFAKELLGKTEPKNGEPLWGGDGASAVTDPKIQLPDLRGLDVKSFMAAVNNDGDKSFVSIEEIRAAVQNDKLPSAGREYLQKVHLDQFPVGTTGVLIAADGVQRNLEVNQAKQLGNGQATIQDVPASPPEKLWG